MQHSDPTQSLTEGLSDFLSGPDGTLALARIQTLGQPTTRSTELTVPVPAGDTVGIWRREDGRLRRDTGRREEWRYWADLPELPLRAGTRRVAVLGESATRGYFFDPVYSLAGLIDSRLTAGQADVLDLARTNCSLPELLRTAAEACALGVDALVVHAGNNWNNVDPTPTERHQLAGLIAEGGFPAATAAFRTLVADVAASALDLLRELAGPTPVVLVVPEFNLADWVDEPMLDCPALPEGRLPRWLELRRAAEQALESGELTQARTLVAELLRLDGGSSPVTHRLAARCAETPDAVRAALGAARDSVVSPFAVHSPRTLTAVQDLLRERGEKFGFRVVDQRTLFQDGQAGQLGQDGLPGRQFFLDYCHLSFDGLRRTADAVADTLAEVLSLTVEAAAPVEPAADRLALAHFLAAVHNAHYGQGEEILRHHVARALDTDAAVAERIEDYLDYQTRRAPNWMCSSYERSAQDPSVARYLVVGDGRLNGKLADHALREVMLDELERHGRPVRERHQELLVAEHAAEHTAEHVAGADLLADPALAATFNERRGTAFARRVAYLRAHAPLTRSTLVLAEPAELTVEVTWRLPGGTVPAGVRLAVNGQDVGAAELGTDWRSDAFTVRPELLRRGGNTVEIHWPLTGDGLDGVLRDAGPRLECAETVPCHPVHGHVHDWSVRPVGSVGAR
ncbi:hypothetical protein [Streptomyces sp. CBMA123]|uniref:hypothetical protein n=1 Tax=Streptomyces sp. CBMA123 TaxID=1896313 RepID=UPI001661C98E|nr:hypothetical protein [Streptomyces sp. CBMA123]MBD0694820.1 hypothetical protein [Streptomyces sp. CBMA123]